MVLLIIKIGGGKGAKVFPSRCITSIPDIISRAINKEPDIEYVLNTIYSNDFINKIKINIHRHKRYKYVKNFNSLQIHNPNDPFLRSIIQERMNSDPLSLSYKSLDEYIEDKYKYLGSQSLYSS